MNTRFLNEAIRFSAADYDEILSDTKLRVGYEIEFVPAVFDSKLNNTAIQTQVLDDLSQLGISVTPSHTSGRSQWALTVDNSIKTQIKNVLGLELISPPMTVATALDRLEKIFNWMREKGHTTNSTTGFHVSVSYGGKAKTQKADPLKLVLLLGERYLLQSFQREANKFTQGHLDSLKKTISDNIRTGGEWNLDPGVVKLKQKVMDRFQQDKYHTVNLGKQAKNGYFEFRIMGNANYHLKFKQVQDTILRYCFVLKASLDPSAWEKEYLHELGSLIIQAVSEAQPVFPDRVIRFAVLPSASPEQDVQDLIRCQENFEGGNHRAAFSLGTCDTSCGQKSSQYKYSAEESSRTGL